ncbi:MAG: SsrA-binding protein [Desulfobacteraceae bacterium 4572_19]|nr:MAG: SsrA-binding protein [Desulfobacteraceae bacterium 4572_19]
MEGPYKKLIASNKKARHSYAIDDDYEAGIILVGSEVKSLRNGKVNLKESYASIKNGEIFVYQLNIGKYSYANIVNHDPTRPRKLLLNKAEIKKITRKVNEKGMSIIPLKIYFKNSKIKLQIGLGKGKKLYDKRESLKQRDVKRELGRLQKKEL